MWATKVNNIGEEEDGGNKELDAIIHGKVRMENFSGKEADFGKAQSYPSVRMMTEHESFNTCDQVKILTKNLEQFIDDITTWKKMIDKNMKSMENDIKTGLKIQKDTINSYLSMKKENSVIKEQFFMELSS